MTAHVAERSGTKVPPLPPLGRMVSSRRERTLGRRTEPEVPVEVFRRRLTLCGPLTATPVFGHPDVDVGTLEVTGGLSLSGPDEHLLPLRWIALLYGRIGCDLSASTGIHDTAGAAKVLLAGASTVQVTSALYRHGIEHLKTITEGLEHWMAEKDFESVDAFRGRVSRFHTEKPELFERAQYIKAFVNAE